MFMVIEPFANMGIERKLGDLGAEVERGGLAFTMDE